MKKVYKKQIFIEKKKFKIKNKILNYTKFFEFLKKYKINDDDKKKLNFCTQTGL